MSMQVNIEAEMRKCIERHVREGYLGRDEIVRLAVKEADLGSDESEGARDDKGTRGNEWARGDVVGAMTGAVSRGEMTRGDIARAALVRMARQSTDRALGAHAEREASWGEELTDCDKLDRAFAALGALGIVARQNFSCCNSCGHRDIEREMRRTMARRDDGGDGLDLLLSTDCEAGELETKTAAIEVRGYAFFHQEDTERAARSGILYVTFGAVEAPEGERTIEAAEAIGRQVTEALAGEGLSVDWTGSAMRRISVSGLEWKKRRGLQSFEERSKPGRSVLSWIDQPQAATGEWRNWQTR